MQLKKSYSIRRCDYDDIVSLTLGPEKHHLIYEKIASPVNEVAVALGTETKEYSFTAMQRKHDQTFTGRCHLIGGAKPESELSFVGMKYVDEVNELAGKLCVDSTTAILTSAPYVGQLAAKICTQMCLQIKVLYNDRENHLTVSSIPPFQNSK